jgi:hypothetical protein
LLFHDHQARRLEGAAARIKVCTKTYFRLKSYCLDIDER